MTDPIENRARRAADSVRSATSGTEVPPISRVARRVSADRAIGIAFVVTLISGLAVVGALAGTGRSGNDAAEGAATSSTSSSTSTSSPTTSTDVTTTTSFSGLLQDVWQGPGNLRIEFLRPDSFAVFAAADLTDGDGILIHIQDDAQELPIRVRFSGTASPDSTVLVSGIPVVVDGNSTWSSEIDLTLHQDDRTVVVVEVDGLAYAVRISLDDDPADHSTVTTIEPGHGANGHDDNGDHDATSTTIDHDDDHHDDDDDTSVTTIEPGHDDDTTTTTSG